MRVFQKFAFESIFKLMIARMLDAADTKVLPKAWYQNYQLIVVLLFRPNDIEFF